MKNKKNRLQAIIDLIKSQCIGSQEELSQLLVQRGYEVTQATLSRDLKQLRTTKVATDMGNYMYIIPDSDSLRDSMLMRGQSMAHSGQLSGFVSINFSGHCAVIKTRNGYASGLAYDIDMSKTPEILGTIAGADTLFAMLREDVTHEEALKVFARFIPIKPAADNAGE